MANPRAWLPFQDDTSSRRAVILGAALVLSLGIHVGLPFMRWNRAEAVSESAIVVELMPLPPVPLPEAEELVPTPAAEDEGRPDTDAPASPPADAPSPPAEPSPPPAPSEAPPAAVEPPPPDVAPLPPPAEPPPAELAPSPDAPPAPPTPEAARAARLAELERRRAERMAERERRRAEREAAQRNGRGGASDPPGGEAGGAPPSGEWRTGKPSATWLCSATDRGTELRVTRDRPMSEWVAIVPTAFGGFVTRPNLGGYVEQTRQVVGRDRKQGPRRIGNIELSLPNDVLQLELEEPRSVRLALGRLDARCLVGLKYASGLFPFSMLRAPVRIIDGQNNMVAALVDVTFYKDAWLDISSADGTPLPFKRARLKNGNAIKQNIQDHFEAARLARGIAEVFGIDLRPKRKTPARDERQRGDGKRGDGRSGDGKSGDGKRGDGKRGERTRSDVR